MREEDKNFIIAIIITRIFFQGYKIFRFVYVFNVGMFDNSTIQNLKFGPISFIVSFCFEILMFILILITTVICYNNFGKGLKEILISQKAGNTAAFNSENDKSDNSIHKVKTEVELNIK